VIVYVDELIEPRYSTNRWRGMFLMNDYLNTTSFWAPNSVNFSDLFRSHYPRMAFVFDAFDSLAKTELYLNEFVQEPPPPENKAPELVIDVDPTIVGVLESVTVDIAGTYGDHIPWRSPVTGTMGLATSYWSGSSPAPVFTHEYLKSGVYTVTVTATDKYGAKDVKTAPVTVTSDGAIPQFTFGWNTHDLSARTGYQEHEQALRHDGAQLLRGPLLGQYRAKVGSRRLQPTAQPGEGLLHLGDGSGRG
jgi:hypothetical protein